MEEPEAHLHPAMQYKLFKYLGELDKTDNLNQQIFVTTHSSNISAVAGIDNMFMPAYTRSGECSEGCQQSLSEQFQDKDGTTNKADAKAHLTKFLDVTRSDMIFADKVILVEGIAEKLLMPMFMERCGCPYEDEHISIVEIGGKHFEHFVELYNENAVKKKVLCITDKDFKWIGDDNHRMRSFAEYEADMPSHIEKLKKRFTIDNFAIYTQTMGGRTFEGELFLANIENLDIAKTIFKKAISESLRDFVDKYGLNFIEWDANRDKIDGRSLKCISGFLDAFKTRTDMDAKLTDKYEQLLFAEMFLHYAEGNKGDIALGLLVDEKLADEKGTSKLFVPKYIQEGLEWLLK